MSERNGLYQISTVVLLVILYSSCRKDLQKGASEMEPAGEPEKYSATVIRTIEEDGTIESTTTYEARFGDQRREEWSENGRKRALIIHPSDGIGFLLDVETRTYVEVDLGAGGYPPENQSQQRTVTRGRNESDEISATEINEYFQETQPPTHLETLFLPAVVIDGHRCSVVEFRATYPDGHTETTRRFRAGDLSGLILRVESENNRSAVKMITERRNVSLDVSEDTFKINGDFKKR